MVPSVQMMEVIELLPFQLLAFEILFHSAWVPLNVIVSSLVQPLKAKAPILVTLFGIVIFAKLVQPENALSPILVTPFGIVIFAKLVQL